MTIFKRCAPVFAVLCTLGTLSSAAWAAPGWELSANTYPTNLVHGIDEVQEVVPNPEASSFTLSFEGHTTPAISTVAKSPSTVQADLEALPSIGVGSVKVTESAGVYFVTFTETLGDMEVASLGAAGAGVSVKTGGSASGTIGINAFNIGSSGSQGTIIFTDTLPPGIRAKEAGELKSPSSFGEFWGVRPQIRQGVWDCTGNGPGAAPNVAGATVVTCTNNPVGLPVFQGGGGVPIWESANPEPAIGISVEAGGDASDLVNRASISGGGAPVPASTEDSITVGPSPAHSGLVGWDAWFSNADGTIDTQAGSHPYEMTSIYSLATSLNSRSEAVLSGGETRNVEVRLPPGFVGNTAAITQCTHAQIAVGEFGLCPETSEVGILKVETTSGASFSSSLFNMVPPRGEPAQFGYKIDDVIGYLDVGVRTGGDAGITVHVNNIPQRLIESAMLTIWGTPGDKSHDRWRAGEAGGCTQKQMEESQVGGNEDSRCTAPQFPDVKALLTLPTSCGEPQPIVMREISGWQLPDAKSEVTAVSHDANGKPLGFTGCEYLAFDPSITTSPDTSRSDTPAGLTVDVRPVLGELEAPGQLGTSDIQKTVLALPPGFVINPGQAAGLQACGPAESGLTSDAEKARGEENDGPSSCPNASKVGTVKARTPLLEGAAEKELEGNVYVLQSNPPHLKLLAAFSADGVNIKLVLNVELDPQTGQLTTTVPNIPAFPVSDFKLSFSGGPQAALDTPVQCGTYTATSDFTSWSSPFISDATPSAQFTLSEGPEGQPCPSNPLPFSPTMTAGATTDQAGGFTNFSMLLQRADGQQRIEKLSFKAPEGLAGMISRVPQCQEPQAATGACPAASHIGHASVASGPGPYPLVIPQPGEPEAPIYLTGPYDGAPFGLAIVTPVIAGPFNLGTIITRAKIEIDPHTAQVTVVTDALPQIVDGVPTDLRAVDAVIDRPGFMFNPTDCRSQSFSGTAFSAQGAIAPLDSHFQMGSCRSLLFKPNFKVSTSGRTSRAQGASLTAKIVYPTGPLGANQASGQSNIASVKVDLPKQLPSRLTTLQKACPVATFDANPASCPKESIVGHATAVTPVLSTPLTGPAYFVSHAGEEFPQLVVVLQGDGVTIDLVGDTFINSKTNVTSSTFKEVPDVPISSFELVLPQGKYSALAANGNLCKSKLKMPTTFTGHNGAVIHQSTPIGVNGCTKAKHKSKKPRKAKPDKSRT